MRRFIYRSFNLIVEKKTHSSCRISTLSDWLKKYLHQFFDQSEVRPRPLQCVFPRFAPATCIDLLGCCFDWSTGSLVFVGFGLTAVNWKPLALSNLHKLITIFNLIRTWLIDIVLGNKTLITVNRGAEENGKHLICALRFLSNVLPN